MEFDSPTGSFREIPTDPSFDASDDRFNAAPEGAMEARSDGPCQLCGATPARVESYMWVMSFVLLTRHAEYQACLCRRCATKQALKEQVKSGLLGWWGIPWGLLTLKALWINARTLTRWSLVGPIGGLATVLAILLVPATLGYLAFNTEDAAARRAGNVVSDDVVELVEDGNRSFAAGDDGAALKSYLAAHRKAPGSSVVNYSIAQTYAALGDNDAALPYAAAAERIDGDDPTYRAMHGWLLHLVHREDEAAERLEALRGVAAPDLAAAVWIADLFEAYGETEEQLRVVDGALQDHPGEVALLARRLSALVALDRLEEASALVAEGPPEDADDSMYSFALAEYRMRTDPAAATEELIAHWMDSGYNDFGMGILAAAAERAGALESSRRRIETFLFDPATPGNAWGGARPWFDDTAWPEALDRYLAQRPEALPALFRLSLYSPMSDARQIRNLAERVQAQNDPVMPYIDSIYFGYGFPGRSLAAQNVAVEAHLAEAPDHTLCALHHASLLAVLSPSRARELLPELREQAADGPSLRVELTLLDAAITSNLAEPRKALALLQELGPSPTGRYATAGDIDLAVAEAAFQAGVRGVMQNRLKRLLDEDGEADNHAAALLVRWSDQLAAHKPVTYRQDVDAWIARYGAASESLLRSSVQAILGVEGRVPLEERRAMLPVEVRGTVDLVALFKRAGETGEVDWEGLRTMAGSPYTFATAPSLARRVLEVSGES